MSITISGSVGSPYGLTVADATHPIVAGLPGTFSGHNATYMFSSVEGDVPVVHTSSSLPVVAVKPLGTGNVILIGFDYYEYNSDMARLLANAVQMSSTGPSIAVTSPNGGEIWMNSILSGP